MATGLRLALTGLILTVAMPDAAAAAEALIATRTIRATEIVGPGDIAPGGSVVPGALTDPDRAVGQEARVILYAGRPIRPGDLGPPALVERNATVTLVFRRNGLSILADGRALGRAGPGEALRVMNLASRNTVTGIVGPDGSVQVGDMPGAGHR